MKIQLPKTQKGFTLIELLVVVAILAILAVIGATVYNNVQVNARDARRKADIDAIASALEANKAQNSATYTALANSQFQQQIVPVDTTTAQYSIATGTTAPGTATTWASTDVNPTAPTGYATVAPGSAGGVAAWTVCARLESNTFYCKSNSQ